MKRSYFRIALCSMLFAFILCVQTSTTKVWASYQRYVTASSLRVRTKPSIKGNVVGSYQKGKKVTCYGTSGNWTKVKFNGSYRYISTNYVSREMNAKVTGTTVANFALQFVGNPYVWGGTSLTQGADCSGFTMAVYARFGYCLPHSSVGQRLSGIAVSKVNRRVGDLICYDKKNGVGHVGIYIGNNKVVHAGSSRTGIHTSTWNYRSVNCVRRIVR